MKTHKRSCKDCVFCEKEADRIKEPDFYWLCKFNPNTVLIVKEDNWCGRYLNAFDDKYSYM